MIKTLMPGLVALIGRNITKEYLNKKFSIYIRYWIYYNPFEDDA